jgi:Ca-activated chloride channel family protein
MKFSFPHCFWILTLLGPMIVLDFRSFQGANAWYQVFSGQRQPFGSFVFSLLLKVFAFGFFCTSLAGPAIPHEKIVFYRPGICLALGLDISKSMLAEDSNLPEDCRDQFDLKNRLNQSRCFGIDLVSQLRGEKIGAFAFAGEALELIPLTTDYGYCRYILRHINEEDIVRGGSDLSKAIQTGISILEGNPQTCVRAIILISDGENTSADPAPLRQILETAGNQGITIYAVGVGMPRWSFIPRRSPDRKTIYGFFEDQDGQPLRTRLVAEALEQAASQTGGRFFQSDGNLDASIVLKAVLEDAGVKRQSQRVEMSWLDISPMFLLAGIVCFFAAMIRN